MLPQLKRDADGGITLHVLGSNGTGADAVTYSPQIVPVGPPSNTTPVLQNAINAANPGNLLVLSPGTYNENVLVWKPLKLQGLGPGGIDGGIARGRFAGGGDGLGGG